ncbi:glutaredoxin family protein [Winogradskyella sp.]|uniref:glutaredoxin family protein n=1 Tax=Winogradskyella sp. TaxID=1883156 RepID=UPI0026076B85|nr:glutaredoxin family protein [Winogradskyella sp.]
MEKKLELYGTGWCTKSAVIRNFLQSEWIEFEDFNVEEDSDAEEKVRNLYDGELKFPTLIYGNQHLKNPTIAELKAFLKSNNIN